MSFGAVPTSEQQRLSEIKNNQKRRRESKTLRRAGAHLERATSRAAIRRYNRARLNGVRIDNLLRQAALDRKRTPHADETFKHRSLRDRLLKPFSWMVKPLRQRKVA